MNLESHDYKVCQPHTFMPSSNFVFFSAVAMHQQQSTEVLLAEKRYKFKETTKEEYLTSLLEAEIVLKQAVKWLLYEPFSSPEGRLAQRALQELRDLRKLVVQVQSSDGDKNGKNKKRNRK